MAPRSLKAMARARAPVFGTFVVEFDTPGMGHILAAAGCDFVFHDMEHSGFGIESVKRSLRYYEAAGVRVIVRPPSKAYHHIATVLDAGAEGVCLPMVGSAAQAEEIVACVKYPPAGARGIALQVAHDHYTAGVPAEKMRAANRRTCVVPLIETAEGVANVDAIAAVKGVDMLWIGHFDLSASLGSPGQFDHPDFKAAVRRVLRASAKHDLSLGMIAGSAEHGLALIKSGFNFICYSGDVWLLRDNLRAGIEGMRAGLARRRKTATKGKRKT